MKLLPALGLTCAALLADAPLFAQANQPVYPVYDGFVRQTDGTLVLSFAYFNHNSDVVTIPAGETNGFGPAPADRGHPTRFKPGHHRYQCIMVVDANFDGKLRWRLTYGGTTTFTSERMLQYSWELEEAAARQAMRGIDVAKAPRGVCLNRPPIVRVLGLVAGGRGADGIQREGSRGLHATAGQELRIFGSVEDEGLPRGKPVTVTWKKMSGPGDVRFSDAAAARTRATFSAPGAYQLELAANDSERDARTTLNVFVKD
jgi:hypothetical protein